MRCGIVFHLRALGLMSSLKSKHLVIVSGGELPDRYDGDLLFSKIGPSTSSWVGDDSDVNVDLHLQALGEKYQKDWADRHPKAARSGWRRAAWFWMMIEFTGSARLASILSAHLNLLRFRRARPGRGLRCVRRVSIAEGSTRNGELGWATQFLRYALIASRTNL